MTAPTYVSRICTAAVRAALTVLERHGGAEGPDPEKAMRYALLAGIAEQERHEADERAHARRREDPLRLAETRTILDLVEARKRTREYVEVMASGEVVRYTAGYEDCEPAGARTALEDVL
jgi:hypothetical protein